MCSSKVIGQRKGAETPFLWPVARIIDRVQVQMLELDNYYSITYLYIYMAIDSRTILYYGAYFIPVVFEI